jgi:hypothetical protein
MLFTGKSTLFQICMPLPRHLPGDHDVQRVRTLGHVRYFNPSELRLTQSSCAAKYKSVQALRGERELFEKLSTAVVLKASLSTQLVMKMKGNSPITVQSDRPFIHHEADGETLKLYVPEDRQQRRACYRSQLPKLLAEIMGIESSGHHAISVIMSSDLRSLDDVLIEQDIYSVSWMKKPILDISDDEDATVSTLTTPQGISSTSTRRRRTSLSSTNSDGPSSSEYTLVDPRSSSPTEEAPIPTPPPPQYADFVEHVLRNARTARYANTSKSNRIPVSTTPPTVFDRTATFGNRTTDQMTHDRRIGAAGEAFVFETLLALNLPNFTRANWRSTIRGELALHAHYADMPNWSGRETADIIYKDTSGSLTRWLRGVGTGGFPEQISEEHDFAECPIEYYLEVKSTTGACGSRFFLSSGQYTLVCCVLPIMRAPLLTKYLDGKDDATRWSATQ